MPKILVDSDLILSLRRNIEKQTQAVQNISQQLFQVSTTIDMKFSLQEPIKQSIEYMRYESQSSHVYLEQMVNALAKTTSDFLKVDKQLRNQVKELEYQAEHINRGCGANRSDVPALSLGEIGGTAALFGITQEGQSTIKYAMECINEAMAHGNIENLAVNFEKNLSQYLTENDPSLLFGQYNFSMNFINGLSSIDSYLYCLKNWKQAAKSIASIFFGGINSVQNVAEAFLENPDECKAILRNVIDEICQTDYLEVFSRNEEECLKSVQKLAESAGFTDAATFMDIINEMVGDFETTDKLLKDYSANIAMLESLKELAPNSSMLSSLIDGLMADYMDQANAFFFDDIKSKAEEGLIDIASYVTGLNIDSADKIIQKALSGISELDAISTVVYSSEMKSSAISNFQKAASIIRSGNYSSDDLVAYKNSFNFARTLTLQEYKAMLTYYDSETKEAFYLKDQISRLEGMSYNRFYYATAYSTFTAHTAFGGGGVGGGFR